MKIFFLIVGLICIAGVVTLTSKKKEKGYKIAILTPTTHPSLEQIEKGFVDTLVKHDSKKFEFKTYNALGNKTLMRSEAEEISLGNYDLVFAIAAQATRTTKEVFEKKKLSTPIVFSAVPNPLNSI